MAERLREAGTGLLVAAAVVLLLDLAGQLQRGGEATFVGPLRWSLVALLAVGAIVGGLPTVSRRGALVPAVAAAVLAWPIVAAATIVPGPPGWLPLLSTTVAHHAGEVTLLIGALAALAVTRRL